ncbi:hypothetical protein KFK09_022636 [Dendrobium nobile]|uniref:Uncharacterized protein n=1 Tax=Dendrobium nobile TaxID=94219 RepID=A0A8T3AJP5_DENNO|nr:hypothetical protein KFK09_022636 [Dendrobium nobile]
MLSCAKLFLFCNHLDGQMVCIVDVFIIFCRKIELHRFYCIFHFWVLVPNCPRMLLEPFIFWIRRDCWIVDFNFFIL